MAAIDPQLSALGASIDDLARRAADLAQALEGDGANDAFRRASDELDEALGLRDADGEPVPQDEAVVDDTMP